MRRWITGKRGFACLCFCIWMAVWPVAPVRGDTPSPSASFLGELASQGIPAGYGEVLTHLTDGAKESFAKWSPDSDTTLTTLLHQMQWRKQISDIYQAINRLNTILDVGGKFYAGQTSDAVFAGAMAVIGEVAGSTSGKALLNAKGIALPFITAFLVSVQIAWESHKAMTQETVGSQLQQLYGAVERLTGNYDGRAIGQGDPFPVTPDNIELVWRRILYEPEFRELFRVYVVDQLKITDFPQSGFFEKFDTYFSAYVGLPTAYGVARVHGWLEGGPDEIEAERERTVSYEAQLHTGAAYVEHSTQIALKKEYDRIKPYIAGLVGQLNRAAKAREQLVAAQRGLLDLKNQLSTDSSSEEVFEKLQHALDMSGVVQVYLGKCMEAIAKAAEEGDYRTLQSHMSMSVNYVRDVVAWLPATGPTAELHKELLDGLEKSYTAAHKAFEAFRAKLRERVEAPKPPQQGETAPASPVEDAVVAAKVDPVAYFNDHFKPLLVPFDWGGLGGYDDIRKLYDSLLERGQIGAGFYRAEDAPLADTIARAWQLQNFPAALNPPPGFTPVPLPAPEETIKGYEQYLTNHFKWGYPNSIRGNPPFIIAYQRAFDEKWAAAREKRKSGEDLNWGRNPSPPADETREQRAARLARAKSIMDEADAEMEALRPESRQLAAMKQAWQDAGEMALAAATALVTETQMEYEAVTLWMNSRRAEYSNLFQSLTLKREDLVGRLSGLTLASIEDIDDPASAPSNYLGGAREWLEENAYTHLTPAMFSAERYSVHNINVRLVALADQWIDQANTIGRRGGASAGAALRRADIMERDAAVGKTLVAEHAEEIARIRQYIDPSFLQNDTMAQQLAGTSKVAQRVRAEAQTLAALAEQHATNMMTDGVRLRQLAAHYDRFVSLGKDLGILVVSGQGGAYGFSTPPVTEEFVTLDQPYPHFLTEAEKVAIKQVLHSLWHDTTLKAFADRLAPWLGEAVRDYFQQFDALPGFKEENFRVKTAGGWFSPTPITQSGLTEAENRMADVAPGTEAFTEAFASLMGIMPMEMKRDRAKGNVITLPPVEVPEGLELARRYMALRQRLFEDHERHLEKLAAVQEERRLQAMDHARSQLPGLIAALNDRIRQCDGMIKNSATIADGDRPAIEKAIAALTEFYDNKLLSDPYFEAVEMHQSVAGEDGRESALVRSAEQAIQGIGRLTMDIRQAIEGLRARQTAPAADLDALANAFYEDFRSAYESRDTAQVMRRLDDRWSAGDGTTLYDLEVTFSRMFDMFDNIRFDLRGLKVEAVSENRVRASYNVVITGRIYQHRLEHVERSTVNEELLLDGERSRILRTLQGSFWYSN